MPIQDQLAYALDRNDQEPNKILAKQIVDAGGEKEIRELISFIETKPNQRAKSDAILTMAYVAELSPKLMAGQIDFLTHQLASSINRVIFGSMIALAHVAHMRKEKLYKALPKIIDAMDDGTVVTRDHGYRIMITLYADERFQEDMFLLIQEQLIKAPSNQLGQYTERLIPVLNKLHLNTLIETLEERRSDVTNEYHINRLNKNLKKLYKLL
ncbi:hypothetical protein SAMN05421640_1769 [Ekhidna lutea]|uniref:HEAT repeat-containing protein n=1 Tax=Ekhidna lutea TaxID=447679 RepID=A0A239IQ18_EKHLU|nr:hypothetical protein [Ekhidna lutea]SNS95649.1 hypothetical protein SAMN05421640_1769 [Ekhidna lutea]